MIKQNTKKSYATGNCNFQFEFSATALAFAKSFLTKEWTLDECLKYISDNELSTKYQATMKKIESGDSFVDEDLAPYWIVAQDIREKFFLNYYGLEQWIDTSVNFAIKNGYVTSHFGGIRRLPILKLSGVSEKKEVVGELKTFGNMAVNAPVQHCESGLMFRAELKILDKLKEEKLDAWIVNSIHDSCVMVVKEEHVDRLCEIIHEVFDVVPEELPVPMEAEIDVFDPNKGEYW
jgi:DNA polymerase-1